MLQIEPVAVELGNPAGGDQHARLVAAKLEDVEGREQGAAEGQREAVVGRGEEREQVDLGLGLRDGDGAAGVGGVRDGGDGDCEEWFCHG